jgi:hypothetical protein
MREHADRDLRIGKRLQRINRPPSANLKHDEHRSEPDDREGEIYDVRGEYTVLDILHDVC